MSPRERIIPVFVPHLGCPNNCVFCNQHRISGSLRPATAADVHRRMAEAMELHFREGGSQLAFYGGSFTAIPLKQQEELLEAAYGYVRSGALRSVRLSTRPDAVDADTLRRLGNYGVETIEIGAQSLDDNVLRLSGRGHSAEDVERAARLIKAAGFRLIIQLMTGLPGDDGNVVRRSVERVIALAPDGVRIYPTVVIRDTALYELWRAGLYKEHSVEEATELCADLVPMLEEAGISIIRLGLNPTEELSAGSAVAGAYHPALGELVYSRIMRRRAGELISSLNPGENVLIRVNGSCVSKMVGQRRCNIEYLKSEYKLKSIKVLAADIPAGELIVSADNI